VATAFLAWLFLFNPAHAGFNHIRAYYDWGPYYQATDSPPSRVLQATTTAAELSEEQIISGWVERFPNPNAPGANQYYIAIPGQGLVEIGPNDIPTGLDIDALVGQHVAMGTVTGDQLLAPAPPPTDPTLAEQATAAQSNEPEAPELPYPGVTKGFVHTLELLGENISDTTLDLFNPNGAPTRAFTRVRERAAEARHLLITQDEAAPAAVATVTTAIADIYNQDTPEDTTRDLEGQAAGLQVRIEQGLADIPEGQEEQFDTLRQAVAQGVDNAADQLGRAPVTPGTVQALQSLKAIGVLQREQAEFVYGLQSRQEVRKAFDDFAANGYITQADITSALDEAANAHYPEQVQTQIEIEKLQALMQAEAVQPNAATLAQLQTFSANFVPGVTQIPATLLPYWVATVNLDRLQQTIRPDRIPEDILSLLESRKPNTFAKYQELEYRFKPSPEDVTLLEQTRAQLREQYPDAENIDGYLTPQMQRVASFHSKFGLKDPEGWTAPGGITELPFAGPGGLTNVAEINQYCTNNDCSNFAPPSGYAFRPPVGVNFESTNQANQPLFPGLTAFRPPVAIYDIKPSSPTQYVGPGGCTNPEECLAAFREIPPEQRDVFFYVSHAPDPGSIERPDNYNEMTAEERRAYWAEKIASGEKPAPGGPGPADQYGQPLPGSGALWDAQGNFNPGWDQGGTTPYYPPYAQTAGDPDPSSSYQPPPSNTGPLDSQGNPLPGPGAAYPGDDESAPPPASGSSSGDTGSGAEPGGNPDAPPAIPGPADGGPSGEDPNAGGEPSGGDSSGGDSGSGDSGGGDSGGEGPGGNPDAPPPIPGD